MLRFRDASILTTFRMSNKMKFAWLMLCVVPFACIIVHNISPVWLKEPGVYKEIYLMSGDFPPNVPSGPFRLRVSRLEAGWAGREREVELAVYEGAKALSIAKDLRELYQREVSVLKLTPFPDPASLIGS